MCGWINVVTFSVKDKSLNYLISTENISNVYLIGHSSQPHIIMN